MNAEHPEDLIDRAMHELERDLAPQPQDEMLDRRAVEAAMLRMQQMPRMDRPWLARVRAWPRWLRLAAAGVLLASGVTATAGIVGRRISSRARVESPELRPAEPPPARLAPPPVAPPVEVPAPAEQPRPSGLAPRASAPRPAITATLLFERAGKLRREGHADDAIAVYRRLQESFPEAREAQLSFALAGQLLLERGRPEDALAQFDRHPKLGGDVGEEALAGRAAALEQLNRNADAIAAWKSLLERYPGSIYAARARARLAQLGARR
jgi:tetratricopeptide (TPR) repeat protein